MLKKILVPLDGSPLAAKALPYAEALADKFGAELIFLWVLHPMMHFSEEAMGVYETIRQRELEEASTYLRTAQLTPDRPHLKPVTKILEGPVAQTIIDLAEEEKVDLIVMSTHGRSGLGRWMYGSVASKVLQHAPCPIYLVRATDTDDA